MEDVVVRPVEKKDLKNLEEFYYIAYGSRAKYKYPERWNWHFRDNPFNSDNYVHVFIALNREGEIIGHTASSTVLCKIYDKSLALGWSVDTILLQKYRGFGIGKSLQDINQKHQKVFASLAMSSINKNIKFRLGATEGPSTRVYIKFLKFDNSFTSYLLKNIQETNKKKSFSKNFNYDIAENKTFGDKESFLWNKIRERYYFAVERNADYLNWRYLKQPWVKHYTITAFDENNNLTGFLIYRISEENIDKAAIVLELLGDFENISVFDFLLKTLEKEFQNSDIRQIQVAVSDSDVEDYIIKNGYINVEEKNLVISGDKDDLNGLSNRSSCMLTKGDQDWDQFPLAKVYSAYYVLQLCKNSSINNYILRFVRSVYNKYQKFLRLFG